MVDIAWIPVASAFVGAAAALGGNAITQLITLRKAKSELTVERCERLCDAIYASIKEAAEGVLVAVEGGQPHRSYAGHTDRVSWMVRMYFPQLIPEAEAFLEEVNKATSLAIDIGCAHDDRSFNSRGQEFNDRVREVRRGMDLKAHAVVVFMRTQYGAALMLP